MPNTNSLQAMLAEAAKCELVCANCHMLREHNRRKERAQRAMPKAPTAKLDWRALPGPRRFVGRMREVAMNGTLLPKSTSSESTGGE